MQQKLPDRNGSRAVFLGVGAYTQLVARPEPRAGAVELHRILTHPVHGCLPAEHCALVEETASAEYVGDILHEAASQATDLLLIYFAGHGLLGGRNSDLYLALATTREKTPGLGSLPYNTIRDVFDDGATRAKAKVVILECCFSGQAVGHDLADEKSAIEAQIMIKGTAVLASARGYGPAKILPGEKYPAYTGRLLNLLRDGLPDGPEMLDVINLHNEICGQFASEGLRQPAAKVDPVFMRLGLARNVQEPVVAAPQAGTPFEYAERLTWLMKRLGHSYESIGAYAYAHGDYLLPATYRAAMEDAANRGVLPPWRVVSAFLRACFCRNLNLPVVLDLNKPPAVLCSCAPPQALTWLKLYDYFAWHIAAQGASMSGNGDVPPQADDVNGNAEAREAPRRERGKWRKRLISRGGIGINLGPDVFRQGKPANLIPVSKYIYSLLYGEQEKALANLQGIAKRDVRCAASLVAGVMLPYEGRVVNLLQKLAIEEPDITAQLFQVLAETYPVKADRMSKRTGIPLPPNNDESG